MDKEQLLAIVATSVGIPSEVDRTRWPLHVTVAGNFRSDSRHAADISALLESAAGGIAAFDVRLGPIDSFGLERNVTVLRARHPAFHRLHESLAAGLRQMSGFMPVESSYWGSGYLPHATLGPAVSVRDGDILSVRTLSLVCLRGRTGIRLSAVDLG